MTSLAIRIKEGVERRLGRIWHLAVDPLTHPWRLRRARRRLSGFSGRRVLFLCYGNICRSPYAEVRLAHSLGGEDQGDDQDQGGDEGRSRWAVTSAGLYGSGRQSPELAQEVALERGIDLASHRSRRLDEVTVDDTLVVVMEPWQARVVRKQAAIPASRLLVLGDLDPPRRALRSIPDPWGCDKATFADCYRRIDRCIAALTSGLTGAAPT